MCSNALKYALGPALALALCSCGAPRLAYAQEFDTAPVLERLDTIEGYEASSELLASDMSQDVDQMRQDLTDVGDTQRQQLEEIQGLRQELFDTALTLEQREGLSKLDSIDKTLIEIKDAVVPKPEAEGETEGEGETKGDAEAEGETEGEGETEAEGDAEPGTEPATMDDIARLLMINVATTAMLLGVQIWRPLYDVLAGVD